MRIIPKHRLILSNVGRGPIEHELSNRWVIFCTYQNQQINIELIHYFPNVCMCTLNLEKSKFPCYDPQTGQLIQSRPFSMTQFKHNTTDDDELVKQAIAHCEQFLYEVECGT